MNKNVKTCKLNCHHDKSTKDSDNYIKINNMLKQSKLGLN